MPRKSLRAIIWDIFNHIPKGVNPIFFRYYVFSNSTYIIYGMLHVAMIFGFFFIFQKETLGYFNIYSAFSYVIAVFLNRKGYHLPSLIIVVVEVSAFAFVGTGILGNDTGFQIAILALPLLIYLYPSKAVLWKLTVSLFLGFLFYSLYFEIFDLITVSKLESGWTGFFYLGGSTILFAVLAIGASIYSQAAVRAEQKLEIEKQKSENLLLNILPEEIADELKEKGKCTPKLFLDASVMFTDFKSFTTIAEEMRPEELIYELDLCFEHFDNVIARHHLEKIKTIGDSYMCAGGIPLPSQTHAVDCVLAALEIQRIMKQIKEIKSEMGINYWELRLGIHTGPLVAGVVGKHKFAYDIWGDTVNTASRLESTGIAGKVNISSSTYYLIKEFFDCEFRGKVEAKYKGNIDMYFVNHIKPELSINGEGVIPNNEFHEQLRKIKSVGY